MEQPQAEAPATPVSPEDADREQIRRVFSSMRLSLEEIEADTDERVAKENSIRKVCPKCYRRQPIESTICELCGHEPEHWLPSEERRPRQNKVGDIIDKDGHVVAQGKAVGAHLNAHSAQSWLRWAATSASVNELKYIVSTFSGSDDGWKVKHAAKILKLRGETVPTTFWGEEVSAQIDTQPVIESAEPEPFDVKQIDFAAILKRYDHEMAELNRQQ
jgi:ribosomal protein L40E